MGLMFPQALTLDNINDGYDSSLDFTQLTDKQTNNGKNTIITTTRIEQRSGYDRILNSALTKTGVREITALSGVKTRGHFQLKKSGKGTEIEKHCVAAGPNLWNYNSSTASILLRGLSDNDDAIWSFVQIQDPREGASGTDDILIGTNGYDMPIVWNGTDASATYLDDIPGASGVMPAKFILSLKNRIALLNIDDPSDVDAKSKFIISTFTTGGTPQPHVFSPDLSFYVGGSDKFGGITGGATLNGKILIFKKNTFYDFDIGGATTVDESTLAIVHDFSLRQVNENIGCVAPRTIASIGNAVIFMGDLGIYAYDGEGITYISKAIEKDLKNINFARKKYASGCYNRDKNQYWLSISSSDKDYNNMVFVFDITEKKWMTPYDDMRCDIMSNFSESGQEKMIAGDHQGYLYRLDIGINNGRWRGYNLVPTTITGGNTISFNDSQSIYSDGDGLLGLSVRALGATGANIFPRTIIDSTGTQIVVTPAFGSDVTTGTTICVMGIDSYLETKHYDTGSPDILKAYARVSPRHQMYGDFGLYTNYIVDFNDLSKAATATISQYDKNLICFTAGDFATGTMARYSGTIETVTLGASSIAVSAGTDLSASNLAGYCVYLWNSGTRYVRPIIVGECETLELGLYGTQSQVATNTATTYLINTNLTNCAGSAKWGPGRPTKSNVPIRSFATQHSVGEHIAIRFGNNRANEKWGVYGFDLLAKNVGRE